jgi:hypothetical protein
MFKKYWKPLTGLVATLSISSLNIPRAEAEYTFQVTNSGKHPIYSIEVAEGNSNNWGYFSQSGIDPGDTVQLVWGSHTDNSLCVWKLRAVYSDGPSEAASFDFCKSTHIEFDN